MLTAGADNIAGTNGNDTITVVNVNGVGTAATTAQSFDKVDGGAGTDTLNWYATATENATIAGTYSNIEVVNFYGAEKIARAKDDSGTNGIVTANIDASLIGGSQQVWIQSAAAIDTTFSIKGTPTSGGIVVTGLSGKTLGVAGKTAESITGNFGTGAAAALALNAASDAAGTGNAAVNIAGVATSLAVSGAGKATLTDNGTGADTIKTLTVAATGATTLDVTVTGLGALTAIDGSASTGDTTLVGIAATAASIKTGAGKDTFTVTATTKATVDSGAGNDSVTLGSALVAGSTVNLGAGDDKLLDLAANAPAATAAIDGGAGVDTVSGALINAGNGAVFKNFEAIDFAGMAASSSLDAALLTGSTIQKLTVSGALATAGTATIQNVALTAGLEFTGANAGSVVAVQATGASTGTADAYTVTLANGATITAAPNASNFDAGVVALAGVETVNIVSGGTNSWNTLKVGSASADLNATQKIVVTGASNLDLTIGAAQTLVGSATSVALTSVDASAATGKVSITTADNGSAKGAVTLLGGSAADTFVIKNAADTAINGTVYTVTTGAGADTVNVSGSTYGTPAAGTDGNVTSVTDFAAGDKLVFSGSTSFGGTAQAKVDVSAATTLKAALDIAAAGTTGTNIAWFQYAGNTYVVEDNTTAAGGIADGDIVVKLAGVIDLSTATFAANAITL